MNDFYSTIQLNLVKFTKFITLLLVTTNSTFVNGKNIKNAILTKEKHFTTSNVVTSITYFWVGANNGLISVASNWNTVADGTGSTRTTANTTDILIIDGNGTTPGGTTTILDDVLGLNISQLKITNNTNCIIRSNSTSTKSILISAGGVGDDFVIEGGSQLSFVHATNAISLLILGTGNTGDISGTFNLGGSTSNSFSTIGGNDFIRVTSTGIINNSIPAATAISINGSASTLKFENGAAYNVSGATTTAPIVPEATWETSSNLNISGLTTSTLPPANFNQSFGNITYNCPESTAMYNFFGSSTTIIKGNLNINATNTGVFTAVSTGFLTINGDLSINGGTFEASNSNGILSVLGNINLNGGTFDIAKSGTSIVALSGSIIQTGGTLIQTSTSGIFQFTGTTVQNLSLTSHVGTNFYFIINNSSGVNLTSNLSLNKLQLFKGNLTGSGILSYIGNNPTLIYNSLTEEQTMNAKEFPINNGPASLTLNNNSPTRIVTMPFSRTLAGTMGVLTLTSGILDNTGYTITIPNPMENAIVGYSSQNYIKGAVERNLPPNLAAGTTYIFPVGKSSYNAFELINPTTNSGGIVTIKAEVFDGNSGGSNGTLFGNLSSNRYWQTSITSGNSNFINTQLKLYDTIGNNNAIGTSSTQNGSYNNVGGSTTSSGTTLETTSPVITSLSGYFVLGIKASAELSNLTITPSSNQCGSFPRVISISIIPQTGTISSPNVIIKYNINGIAQTPIVMTNPSGNNWVGTIPTITPANGTVTWMVETTDSNLSVSSLNGTTYTDASIPTAPIASNSSQCGSQIPSASISDSNGILSPVFKWYDASTNGNLLQTNSSTTYLSAINTTTTFYVSVVNSTTLCESTRTPITITVNQNTTISLTTANATQTVCNGTSILNIVYALTNDTNVTATFPAGLVGIYALGSYIISGTPTTSGAISVKGTGLCADSTTLTGNITFIPSPIIDTQPVGVDLCAGVPLNLSIAVSGTYTSLQWKKNGVAIIGANSTTYTIVTPVVSDTGMYSCDVVYACNTIVSTVAEVTTNCLEISEISNLEKTSFYPNPTSQFLYIISDFEIKNATIYDLSGRIVFEKEVNTNRIDIGHLENTTYFIKITFENRLQLTKKIVKN